MTNAKEEFLEHIAEHGRVVAAHVQYDEWDSSEPEELIKLKVGHTDEDFTKFIDSLDFTYASGYGCQELFGVIWYEDGSWSERGEYDGSEWWEHREIPTIPEELK